MYILVSAVVETIKTFCMSTLSSVIFSLMIYRDTVVINPTACFILNLTSFLLFLFLYYNNWSGLYFRTYSKTEYIIPAIVSYGIYGLISTFLYMLKAGEIYKWFFQHTRFLEPLLNNGYSSISFILSQILTMSVLIAVPLVNRGEK